MLRSPPSDSSVPALPPLNRKRLFPRVPNPLSSNGKPGPLLDANPPPVLRPSLSETRESSVRTIKTKFQNAGNTLRLLRRFSASNGRHSPHVTHDNNPPSSDVNVKPERGRSYSMQLVRPPSLVWSRSAPDATSICQPSISPTLSMSDGASHTSTTESTLLQDIHVPIDLQTGIVMTKVSAKENKKVTVRIDADLGQIFYHSRRARISESLHTLHTRHGSPGDLNPGDSDRLTCPFFQSRSKTSKSFVQVLMHVTTDSNSALATRLKLGG